ncbi:MAG TPA: protein-disulfide reductase DsbD [Caldimonas sp.]|nr:protein-disulfide reductase DsbD [Caldimonas sp.]HEX2542170.1 protein-disulfide reductase DsbD [Caldimonas sp.]
MLLVCAWLFLGPGAAFASQDFLEPEKAFKFSARALDPKTVEVSFAIAPGYYMYRDQFKFSASGAELGTPVLPAGKVKYDQTFQKDVETYRDKISIVLPVQQAGAEFRLVTTSQGCADAGLCYPPMPSEASVSLAGFGGTGIVRLLSPAPGPSKRSVSSWTVGTAASPAVGTLVVNETSAIEAVLHGGAFWSVVGAFFIAGILLSLTPCVLPMLPIVSSIIVGQGPPGPALATAGGTLSRNAASGSAAAGHSTQQAEQCARSTAVSRRRGFALAASYSFGMAVVYTGFGVAAGLAGEGLAAALQNPWVLSAFAVGLVALALSMFGVYSLQLPQFLACRFMSASQKLPAGRVAGVCAMGGVSALIVSPCVAAPLAGALLYLSQTRDVWLGGTALFSLATGMSVPLLLVGASAGALLPRAGAWMVEVKAAFGFLLLGVALWTIQSLLPAPLVLAVWGVLALAAAAMLVKAGRGSTWRHGAAGLLALVGVMQLVGAAAGGSDPLQPLARLGIGGKELDMPQFTRVRNVGELDVAVRSAGRPVMLDFYADWCVSCKEMERYTLTDAKVQKKLAGALLLKADVTANNDDDRELLKRFRLFGPPGTIFFDATGQEIVPARFVGFQNADRFLETLAKAGL